jgi:Cd2+/Zn2+-exporting ATPase
MDRVRRSVRSLLTLAPAVATVRREDAEVTLPVAQVVPGDTVVIRPGQRVPLDGLVLGGLSSVDQAALTGESLPVLKEPGDALFAGTLNGDGALTMRVTRLAADSSVARIIHLVEQAQTRRAPVQRIVDRFARVYTPAVIVMAVAVAVIPAPLGGDPAAWAYRSLVLLVIACPCALVLSTPISIVSALSAAAKRGILIKGGAVLERAATIDVVALDKTGTLTHGRPVVTDVWASEGRTQDELLALSATLERHSEHPLGRATVTAALEHGLELDEAHDTRALPGLGLVATVGGVEYRVGSRRLFGSDAVDGGAERALAAIEAAGGTAVLVGVQDRAYGVIGFADEAREHAYSAIASLRDAGVRLVVMLTGDREASAERIGRAVGVDQMVAGLLPEDKLAAVGELRQQGGIVAMIGDGINDAPSLAAADVGVAMGVAGSDAAIETADIALMGDDLRGVARVIRLGKLTRRTIIINIALSIGIKAVFLALAIAGAATLWMAILADMGTSLLVIALGLRLLRWRGE